MGTPVVGRGTAREDEHEGPLRSAADAEALLLDVVRLHADELLRVARRHSLCADDAHDAYQRSLELFLRTGRRLHAETAHRWLFTVCKHEAQAVRRARTELVGWEEVDFDRVEARTAPGPEEHALDGDTVARSAEALRGLKPAEVRALWLRAGGRSYAEIQASTGWSYTKVNRCLTEGRRAFLVRYARIEDGSECARWAGVLAALGAGDAGAAELAALRPHLRNCGGCKATLRGLQAGPPPLAVVLPPVLLGPAAARSGTLPERAAQALGWLGRVAEAVTGPAQERAVAGGVKLQAALEAASTGKVAVVAASAAALAGGGGVVVGGGVAAEHHHRPARVAERVRTVAPAAAPGGPAPGVAGPAATTAAAVAAAPGSPASPVSAVVPVAEVSPPPDDEFAAAGWEAPLARERAAPVPLARVARGEFGGPAPTATAATAAVAPPRAPALPARRTAAAPVAGREFGSRYAPRPAPTGTATPAPAEFGP